MTRTLSTAVSNLLDDELVKPFLAVKLPFPSGGTLRLWTGHGDITVDSETYSGAGQFLGISIQGRFIFTMHHHNVTVFLGYRDTTML